MKTTNFVWVIFVVENKNRFPNFFPIGVYTTEMKAKEELHNLPVVNNYQLLKLPVGEFFGYFNKKGELIGMDGVNHWHFHNKEESDGQ